MRRGRQARSSPSDLPGWVDGQPVLREGEAHDEVPLYGQAEEDRDVPMRRVRRKAHVPAKSYPSPAVSPWHKVQPELPLRMTNDKKGSIMINLSERQRKALQIAAVSAVTIVAIRQTKKVANLEKTVRVLEAQKNFYEDFAVRSTTMMTLPQMLGLVDKSVTDMKFRNIIRTNGL